MGEGPWEGPASGDGNLGWVAHLGLEETFPASADLEVAVGVFVPASFDLGFDLAVASLAYVAAVVVCVGGVWDAVPAADWLLGASANAALG